MPFGLEAKLDELRKLLEDRLLDFWNQLLGMGFTRVTRVVLTSKVAANFVIPANIKMARIKIQAAGGGGGSGNNRVTAAERVGGTGGGSGECLEFDMLWSGLAGLNIPYICGTGGTGGAAVTGIGANGNDGTDGTASSFGNILLLGGLKGKGGNHAALNKGGDGGGFYPTVGTGGNCSDGTTTNAVAGNVSIPADHDQYPGSGGGGAGKGVTAGFRDGADGGWQRGRPPGTKGVGDATRAGGGGGASSYFGLGGKGGDAGVAGANASSNTGTGSGVGYGAAGGGGSSGDGTGTGSKKGGDGGDGVIIIEYWSETIP